MTNRDNNCLTGKVKGGCNYRSTFPNMKFQYAEFHYLLNLLVNNNAHGVLSNIIDPSSLAMVTLVGHTFLNSTHTLLRGKTRIKYKVYLRENKEVQHQGLFRSSLKYVFQISLD